MLYSSGAALTAVVLLLWLSRNVICPFVFQRDGRRIKTFKESWKNACKAAGCPGRIVHDLRRTAVRNLVRVGVPQAVAMKMTGHKTDSVFRRYDIVSPNDLRVAAERLNSAAAASVLRR